MGKFLRIVQWVLMASLLLAFAGSLVCLTFIVFESSPMITRSMQGLYHLLAGGQPVQIIFQSNADYMATRNITLTPATWTPSPTSTFTPTVTSTPTETPSPTPTETQTPTETPTPTLTPEPTQIPTEVITFPPDEAGINSIEGHAQWYNLDCESRSAVDLAAYFGIFIDENEFLSRLPISDDPNEGFVGNYWDPRGQIPPNSYGVYSGPIAALLREYGLNAYEARGISWETIRNEIANGRPVEVWVINNTLPGAPISYTPSNGNTTTVAHYQHTVLVIGYTPEYAIILDGDIVYWRTIDQFLDSWSVLGNMAVLVQ